MRNQNTEIQSILSWLLPSSVEMILISALSLITLAVSSVPAVKDVIFLPKDFQLKVSILDSINNLVVHLVGDHVARSAVVAIFWALVGLVVYVIIWLMLNFSGELGNDLAVTKYVHPTNVDTRSPLRNFLSKVGIQFIVFLLLIFYINTTTSVFLPYIGGLFHTAINEWPSLSFFRNALLGLAYELLVFHVFVILVRILTMRKRVFG